MGHGSFFSACCHAAPAEPVPCGMLGAAGEQGTHRAVQSVCVSWEGDPGREGCLLGYTHVQRVEGGKDCVHEAVPSKTKVRPSALSLLCPRGAWLVQGSPERLLSRLSHIHLILAQLAMEFYCLRTAVERSWEELPAHPSHTDLAFMKSLMQQIIPGTCVGVKDGLSKIPAAPACPCFLLAPTEPSLGWGKGCPFPDTRVPLATLQCAHLPV